MNHTATPHMDDTQLIPTAAKAASMQGIPNLTNSSQLFDALHAIANVHDEQDAVNALVLCHALEQVAFTAEECQVVAVCIEAATARLDRVCEVA